MLDIGWSELLIIGVVALVVVGPKDLPKLLRLVGQSVGKIRRMAAEFQGQVNEAIREAELEDVKKSVEDLKSYNPANMIRNEIDQAMKPVTDLTSDMNDEMRRIEAGITSPEAAPASPAADPYAPAPIDPPTPTAETLHLPEIAEPMPPALPEPVPVSTATTPSPTADALPVDPHAKSA